MAGPLTNGIKRIATINVHTQKILDQSNRFTINIGRNVEKRIGIPVPTENWPSGMSYKLMSRIDVAEHFCERINIEEKCQFQCLKSNFEFVL